jgi:hypothetical protein
MSTSSYPGQVGGAGTALQPRAIDLGSYRVVFVPCRGDSFRESYPERALRSTCKRHLCAATCCSNATPARSAPSRA